MLGLEAPIERRRASGSGRITLPGNSQVGDLENQTILILEGNEGCLEYSIWKGQECPEKTCPNIWSDYPCTEEQPFVCNKSFTGS